MIHALTSDDQVRGAAGGPTEPVPHHLVTPRANDVGRLQGFLLH